MIFETIFNFADATATTVPEVIADLTTDLTTDMWDYLPSIFTVVAIIIGLTLAYRLLRKFIGR